METKKKARASVAAPERAETGKTFDSMPPIHNYTPEAAHGQLNIADFLRSGRDSAITRRDLERLTGLDGRTIRAVIERERRHGTPILSDCQHGYFLAGDKTEAEQFVRSMRRRAHEVLATARAVETAMGLD